MKYKRKGKKADVELIPVKTMQRLDCNDVVETHFKDNTLIVHGLKREKFLYAMHALGLKSLDAFDELDYSDEEILAIGTLAAEEDGKGKNPIKGD